MKRVLMVVRRLGSTSRWGSMRGSAPTSWMTSRLAWSSPITEMKQVSAPSATRLRTTLPAPPSMASSRSTDTTGIGASGETRSTWP